MQIIVFVNVLKIVLKMHRVTQLSTVPLLDALENSNKLQLTLSSFILSLFNNHKRLLIISLMGLPCLNNQCIYLCVEVTIFYLKYVVLICRAG